MALLISDCRSAGLVEPDATLSWLCAPRFDAAALFAAAIDPVRGGGFTVMVEGGRPEAQRYQEGTLVVETDIRGPEGLVRVTDCLVIDPRGPATSDDTGELVRQFRVMEGRARVGIRVAVRYGFGLQPGRWMRAGRRTRLPGPGLPLDLDTDLAVRPDGADLVAVVDLAKDQVRVAALRWQDAKGIGADLRGKAAATSAWWARWTAAHGGSNAATALRGLTYAPTGGVVRAATTSLSDPAADGRLCWVADQERALAAYRSLGATAEADRLESWLEAAGAGPDVRGLAGEAAPTEQGLDHLERPIRSGAPAGDALGNVPWLPGLLDELESRSSS